MDITRVIIHADGASRGNPGPASIGGVIEDERGHLLAQISRRIGITTNNQAEYRAVIAALERAINLGAKQAEIRSDSELLVKQINGSYRVKNKTLQPLYRKVSQLIGSLESFSITHVPREQNTRADGLANKALDTV